MNPKGKKMDPKGVGLVHGVLYGAMDHALRLEMIARNPVALVSPPKVTKAEAYTPDVEHVRALLKLAEEKRHPLWECIHLIAYTGMRRGEALALEWKPHQPGRNESRGDTVAGRAQNRNIDRIPKDREQ